MESSQKNTKEAVTNQEVNEQALIAPIESEKNEQEFANETLAKIEGDMDSLRNAEDQVGKIENSTQFDNPTIKEEIRLELDLDSKLISFNDEARVAKEESQEKINLANRDFSKAYHHPDYRTELARQILEARKSGGNMESIRQDFYEKTSNEKENFESQEKERSVAEIMKEKDLVILHGIKLEGGASGSDFNNRVVNNKNLKFNDMYELVAGLEPTISTFIPSTDRPNNGMYQKQGIILGEGNILTANKSDSYSEAFKFNKRIPKANNEGHKHSAIQPEIDVVNVVSSEGLRGKETLYNEITVEKPKIAGLYCDLSEPSKISPNLEYFKNKGAPDSELEKIQEEYSKWRQDFLKSFPEEQQKKLVKMKEYSEKMNVPLYILKNENGELKKYKVSFGEGAHTADYLDAKEMGFSDDAIPEKDKELIYSYDLIPVTASEIYDNKPEISEEAKSKMSQDLKNKNIIK